MRSAALVHEPLVAVVQEEHEPAIVPQRPVICPVNEMIQQRLRVFRVLVMVVDTQGATLGVV